MRGSGARVLLSVAVSCFAVCASAGKPGRAPREQAKIHFKAGSALLHLGEYDRAIAEYLAAYHLLPLPDFLFNIGQAYRLKGPPGDRQQAAKYYRQYLKEQPDGAGSAEARQHLAIIEKEPGLIISDSPPPPREAEPEATSTPPPASAPPPPPQLAATPPAEPPPAAPPVAAAVAASSPPAPGRKSIASRPAFWGILAAGVVLVGAGIAVGVVVGGAPRDPAPSVDVIDFGLGFGRVAF